MKKIDASGVAARPRKAGNKTELDRVVGEAEHDGDRRGRSFGRKRGSIVGGRGDDGHTTADQLSHQRRQAIILALKPVIFDRHVAAFNVALGGLNFLRFETPHYWITSSAVANSVSGMVRPSALAVLRLTISSNLVGCWTGKSPGFSPLRMRPA